MNTTTMYPPIARPQTWSAVGSMALCVAMLIASEFMPVSLLTPIAADLRATEGMAGQAISVSGLFAVITSLFIATIAGRFDRRYVLMGLTALMLASLLLPANRIVRLVRAGAELRRVDGSPSASGHHHRWLLVSGHGNRHALGSR